MKNSQAVAQGPRANESRHTPGPWYALKYPDVKTYTVAAKESVASKIKTIEDAHLIAAAPDMLEALKNASGIVEQAFFAELDKHGWQKDDHELPQHVRWLQKVHYEIRDAIAKAEGRSE